MGIFIPNSVPPISHPNRHTMDLEFIRTRETYSFGGLQAFRPPARQEKQETLHGPVPQRVAHAKARKSSPGSWRSRRAAAVQHQCRRSWTPGLPAWKHRNGEAVAWEVEEGAGTKQRWRLRRKGLAVGLTVPAGWSPAATLGWSREGERRRR